MGDHLVKNDKRETEKRTPTDPAFLQNSFFCHQINSFSITSQFYQYQTSDIALLLNASIAECPQFLVSYESMRSRK